MKRLFCNYYIERLIEYILCLISCFQILVITFKLFTFYVSDIIEKLFEQCTSDGRGGYVGEQLHNAYKEVDDFVYGSQLVLTFF